MEHALWKARQDGDPPALDHVWQVEKEMRAVIDEIERQGAQRPYFPLVFREMMQRWSLADSVRDDICYIWLAALSIALRHRDEARLATLIPAEFTEEDWRLDQEEERQ
jgi:hypothetical protein